MVSTIFDTTFASLSGEGVESIDCTTSPGNAAGPTRALRAGAKLALECAAAVGLKRATGIYIIGLRVTEEPGRIEGLGSRDQKRHDAKDII